MAITKTAVVIALGFIQTINGVLAFLYAGAVLLAGAGYLGIGPGAVPVLIFCLLGTAAGIAMVVRRSVGACRAAAVWDVVVGLFFLVAVSRDSRFHPEGFVFAAILLGMFVFLMEVDAVE